jgi:DNA-binding MarR family transcriptional regulator
VAPRQVSGHSAGTADLRSRLSALIRRYQRDIDAFDQVVSERLGINRTDLRCLDWLLERAAMPGRVMPKMLAKASGLSPSTVTSVLDRLEQAGYLRRVRDTQNRRQVFLEPTTVLANRVEEMFGPVAKDAVEQLSAFSADELEVLIRFFASANERHQGRLRWIRNGASAGVSYPEPDQPGSIRE